MKNYTHETDVTTNKHLGKAKAKSEEAVKYLAKVVKDLDGLVSANTPEYTDYEQVLTDLVDIHNDLTDALEAAVEGHDVPELPSLAGNYIAALLKAPHSIGEEEGHAWRSAQLVAIVESIYQPDVETESEQEVLSTEEDQYNLELEGVQDADLASGMIDAEFEEEDYLPDNLVTEQDNDPHTVDGQQSEEQLEAGAQ
jgi:hypothetical protein